MKNIILLLFACAHSTFVMAQGSGVNASVQSLPPLTTIMSLDIQRYQGTWYELAKYPNWFQRKCVADTRTDYQLQVNGSVQVTNQCRMNKASWMWRLARRAK